MTKIISVLSWKPENGTNFGDHISSLIVERMAAMQGLVVQAAAVKHDAGRLLAVGSILHLAEAGDHVWGAGINGKSRLPARLQKLPLTVHSVRGPITRNVLRGLGHFVPERYGDPGLLFPLLYHAEIEVRKREIAAFHDSIGQAVPNTVFIPNINDERTYLPEAGHLPHGMLLVSPRSDPVTVAAYVGLAERVVSSSLHGIVFADAMARPVTFVASRFEPLLKYDDYFLGTGRGPVYPADPATGFGAPVNVPPLAFDIGGIADSFPPLRDSKLILEMTQKPPLIQRDGDGYLVDPQVLGEDFGWIWLGEGSQYWTHRVARLRLETASILDADFLFIYGGRLADDRIVELFQARINDALVAAKMGFIRGTRNWKIVIPLADAVSQAGDVVDILLDAGLDVPAGEAFSTKFRPGERVALGLRKIAISRVKPPAADLGPNGDTVAEPETDRPPDEADQAANTSAILPSATRADPAIST